MALPDWSAQFAKWNNKTTKGTLLNVIYIDIDKEKVGSNPIAAE